MGPTPVTQSRAVSVVEKNQPSRGLSQKLPSNSQGKATRCVGVGFFSFFLFFILKKRAIQILQMLSPAGRLKEFRVCQRA